MADINLAAVNVSSGVNEHGEGFLTVAASSADGTILIGQLSPTEVRGMALQWLEIAEAAEQDAAVLRCIRKLQLPDKLAGAVIQELRSGRNHEQ